MLKIKEVSDAEIRELRKAEKRLPEDIVDACYVRLASEIVLRAGVDLKLFEAGLSPEITVPYTNGFVENKDDIIRFFRSGYGHLLCEETSSYVTPNRIENEYQKAVCNVSDLTKELCKIAVQNNIAFNTVRARYKAGVRGDDLCRSIQGRAPRMFPVDGEMHTVKEWSEITGVRADTIRARLRSGMPPKECIAPTRYTKRRRTESRGLKKLSEEYGINYSALISRLRRGMELNKALTKPLNTTCNKNKKENKK